MANKFIKPNQDYMPDGDKEVLQKDIAELGLSDYTLSKLKNVGLEKIIDLARCQMKHLYKVPGMNKKNIFEVLKKMQNIGLDFKRSQVAATVIEDNQVKKDTEVIASNTTAKQDKKDNNLKNKENKKDNTFNKKNKDKNQLSSSENQNKQNNNNKLDKKNKQDKKVNFDTKQNINKQNEDIKKVNVQAKQNNNEQPKQIKQDNQKQNPPQRMKVNSYDLDSFINDTAPNSGSKTLKQEREEKIAKAIKELPPIKNADGLYKFYRHGKWGYKTESGKVVIEPTYSEAFNFKEGLACVELNERCGFINKQGEVIIPIQYDTACSFSEGLASVTKDDKCGYIDKEGNIVFDFIYEAATSFENDIALVKKDGKWGYMDRKTGEIRLR